MDIIKTTNELAEILNAKKLSYIYMKDGEVEIELGGGEPPQAIFSAPASTTGTPVATVSAPTVQVASVAEQTGNFVKSPIIGTFYAAPAPDKPAFVKVGDKVEKGQVVCIVESMKLMNEINTDFAGTVAEILAKDGEAVEFDKPLIRIE